MHTTHATFAVCTIYGGQYAHLVPVRFLKSFVLTMAAFI